MTKSALQIARAAYQPKVPAALKGAVKAVDGEYTQSGRNQKVIPEHVRNACRYFRKEQRKERTAGNECRCDPFRWSGSWWS